MDVETSSRGKDRSRVCTEERERDSDKDNLEILDPGMSFPFHHGVGLGRPMTPPNVLDTLEAVVCQVACVAGSRRPRWPIVFLLEANVVMRRPNITLKGHDFIFTTLFKVFIMTFNVKNGYYV
jgi:hypothetical protein